ncbi:MAG: G1 family glutamic endopeptidase [Leifsonia sp.]
MADQRAGRGMDHETKQAGRVRLHPPAPAGFDPFDATPQELARHGLPRRPDAASEGELAALWEQKAARYRHFEHLQPVVLDPSPLPPAAPPALGPDPIDSAGYSLTSRHAPFTSLFLTWTVPDLQFDPDPFGINSLHIFAGLGLLDVHTQLTVTAAQTVTCSLWAQGIGTIGLAVRPGDVVSASLCLNTNAAGTAAYFFSNETTARTMSFSVDTGFPPAIMVDAGVTRDGVLRPGQSLARFGTVYFDEISAYDAAGHQSLLSGEAITMADGSTVLATPSALSDYAFKVVSAR